MKKLYELEIMEEAISWVKFNKKVVIATVINTWGSSPFEIGTKMIINEKGDFLGSVSGGCVEAKKHLENNATREHIIFEGM